MKDVLCKKYDELLTKMFNLHRNKGEDSPETKSAFKDCVDYGEFVERFFGFSIDEYYTEKYGIH